MNRRVMRWSILAAATVLGGAYITLDISTAQTPPAGGPAGPNGPGQAPGKRRGPGPAPGQAPGPGNGPFAGRQPGQKNTTGGQRPGPAPLGTPAKPGAPGKALAAEPPPPPRVHKKGVDPFRIPWSVPPPPPYVFEVMLPVRVADEDIEPPVVTPITIREEPALRVSGIMTGDGVFAILEQAGNRVDIVKPGSSIDIGMGGGSRTYRVASIKDDTVTLESVEGRTTYQQIVPLSDAPIGTTPNSFGGGMGNPGRSPGSFGPQSGGFSPTPGGKRGNIPSPSGGGFK